MVKSGDENQIAHHAVLFVEGTVAEFVATGVQEHPGNRYSGAMQDYAISKVISLHCLQLYFTSPPLRSLLNLLGIRPTRLSNLAVGRL